MAGWWSKSKISFRKFLIMFLTRSPSTLVLRSFSTVILPILPSTSSASMRMPGDYRYCFRLATRNDIPSIASVNVMSLPENYSREYYQRYSLDCEEILSLSPFLSIRCLIDRAELFCIIFFFVRCISASSTLAIAS